jgi:hypothetical protein
MASLEILVWPSSQMAASEAVLQWTVSVKGVVAGNCICLYRGKKELLECWPITASDADKNEMKLTANKFSLESLSDYQFW